VGSALANDVDCVGVDQWHGCFVQCLSSTFVTVLLFDELARRGDAGTGVSSVFGELGFLPLGLSDPLVLLAI